MARLEEFVMPVKQMAQDDFVERHASPFLVWCRAEDDSVNQAWTFKTQTVPQDRAVLVRFLSEEGLRLSPEVASYEAYPIQKTQANPWRDRISIGRARNNDIVLLDNSISKLHAHLMVGTSNGTTITDAGSRNGTQVGQRLLQAQEPCSLNSGDTLLLGRLEMLFLTPRGMYDFIAKHITTVP